MDSRDGVLSRAVAAVTAPLRFLGRVGGYAVSLVLILLGAVVVVSVCTGAWLLVFYVVDLTAGLPVEPLGLVTAVGLPGTLNGVPLVYPLALGLLTALLLGWPTGRERDFSPPLLPY